MLPLHNAHGLSLLLSIASMREMMGLFSRRRNYFSRNLHNLQLLMYQFDCHNTRSCTCIAYINPQKQRTNLFIIFLLLHHLYKINRMPDQGGEALSCLGSCYCLLFLIGIIWTDGGARQLSYVAENPRPDPASNFKRYAPGCVITGHTLLELF